MVLLLTAAVFAAGAETCAAKKRRGKRTSKKSDQRRRALQAKEKAISKEIQILNSRIPIVRQSLQSAQQQLSAEMTRVWQLRSDMEDAQRKVDELSETLESIAVDTEDKRPDDSPLARARARYLEAQQECDALIEQIVDSADYKAVLQNIEDSPDRGRLMAELRKRRIDQDLEVIKARGIARVTKANYEQLRQEVLAEDPVWVDTVEEIRAAKQRYTDLKGELEKAARRQILLKRSVTQLFRGLSIMSAGLKVDKADLTKVRSQMKSHR